MRAKRIADERSSSDLLHLFAKEWTNDVSHGLVECIIVSSVGQAGKQSVVHHVKKGALEI